MVFQNPIRAVVFDMDGLLLDTEVRYKDVILAAAAERGAPLPVEVFNRMIGTPLSHSLQVLAEFYGPDYDGEALFEDATERFKVMTHGEDLLKAGVRELIAHLEEMNIPRAIATSSGHESVRRHLEPNGVLARFDAVIARGDYEKGKPAPDPFLTAARALGVSPEHCLALEDSYNGVRAAHAAGMMTVMVPDLLAPTDEMRDLAVAIADSLHHVLDLVKAHQAGA
ncbi:HAD family hydrolase [Caulobacter sp. KR2-114]|uniref:HAD family hydrolase n=1 Tax=Caulobacter sp. KR2-114 TaxID=3400912 RepID=UPI003BFAC865